MNASCPFSETAGFFAIFIAADYAITENFEAFFDAEKFTFIWSTLRCKSR
ncbi:hypothetical protein MIZ03_1548 [Rhodoferax lithotrophicus]|uniref:Uncharacterized protein n=1 Tax=Rhodoferax lithotrophicus TaxID=2798804 RepID=A0ABM7MK64_9BURK|nr:hypothetical protein MIZ03_1548 [Rhodoferax sp. MIZ03]